MIKFYMLFPLRLLIITITILINSQTIEAKTDIIKKAESQLIVINKSLESLDIYIRNSNYNDACLEALNAAKLIKDGIDELQIIEPFYDWLEIREVLIQIPNQHCTQNSKEKNS